MCGLSTILCALLCFTILACIGIRRMIFFITVCLRYYDMCLSSEYNLNAAPSITLYLRMIVHFRHADISENIDQYQSAYENAYYC